MTNTKLLKCVQGKQPIKIYKDVSNITKDTNIKEQEDVNKIFESKNIFESNVTKEETSTTYVQFIFVLITFFSLSLSLSKYGDIKIQLFFYRNEIIVHEIDKNNETLLRRLKKQKKKKRTFKGTTRTLIEKNEKLNLYIKI